MKISRKVALLITLVGILGIMSFAFASTTFAQNGDFCTDIGLNTDGDILVDVPQELDGIAREQVQCNIFIGALGRQQSGTPVDNQRVVLDYPVAIAGLDVWTRPSGSRGGADFDVYDPPIRICFTDGYVADYGYSAADAVSPEDSAAGLVGPSIVFQDARYTFADRLSNASYRSFSRNVTQLNIVPEGRDLGYICADISWPGAVVLVSQLPLDREEDSPYHPNYGGDTPDRCRYPGASDCRN